ncbi:MAG: cupin domain-containing protein [Hyphomonadaceae bacterium]|nr:cupin domain-containing protein [Hyphomonadaceae bacterium]
MSDKQSPLDPEVVAALNAAARPVDPADPANAAAIERVRAQVMQMIAADSARHHVVIKPDDGTWHPFVPGITRKVLSIQDGVMSYLLKFEPGAVLPAHRHPIDEECVVLEGTLKLGGHLLPAGSFHRVPRDVLDCESSSDEGTVIYLRGASPRSDHLI